MVVRHQEAGTLADVVDGLHEDFSGKARQGRVSSVGLAPAQHISMEAPGLALYLALEWRGLRGFVCRVQGRLEEAWQLAGWSAQQSLLQAVSFSISKSPLASYKGSLFPARKLF